MASGPIANMWTFLAFGREVRQMSSDQFEQNVFGKLNVACDGSHVNRFGDARSGIVSSKSTKGVLDDPMINCDWNRGLTHDTGVHWSAAPTSWTLQQHPTWYKSGYKIECVLEMKFEKPAKILVF
jgi:hypothetical protein